MFLSFCYLVFQGTTDLIVVCKFSRFFKLAIEENLIFGKFLSDNVAAGYLQLLSKRQRSRHLSIVNSMVEWVELRFMVTIFRRSNLAIATLQRNAFRNISRACDGYALCQRQRDSNFDRGLYTRVF